MDIKASLFLVFVFCVFFFLSIGVLIFLGYLMHVLSHGKF